MKNLLALSLCIILCQVSSLESFKMRRSCLLMRSFPSESKQSAYKLAKASQIKVPCVILVNPFLDANVGSVSRAMLNFGLHDLRIVNPECNIWSDEAKRLAVGSVELLENAKIFKSLPECVADLQRVFATTSRTRDMTQVLLTPESAATAAVSENSATGILFGREKFGLTNEEIMYADGIIEIPAFEHYNVLNLAQAVNIIGYEVWKRRCSLQNTADLKSEGFRIQPDDSAATRQDLESFLGRLEENLLVRDYQSHISNKNPMTDIYLQYNFRGARNVLQRVSCMQETCLVIITIGCRLLQQLFV